MIIGITGLIGSGKSTVAKLFQEWGAHVLDADRLAHQAYEVGSSTYQSIIALFGPSIVKDNGEIDRSLISPRLSQTPTLRKQLEAIIHPYVQQQMKAKIEQNPNGFFVLDVPLLFEAQMDTWCDYTIFVDCIDTIRYERIQQRKGISLAAAKALEKYQWNSAKKRKKATFTIENNTDIAHLKDEVSKIMKILPR